MYIYIYIYDISSLKVNTSEGNAVEFFVRITPGM